MRRIGLFGAISIGLFVSGLGCGGSKTDICTKKLCPNDTKTQAAIDKCNAAVASTSCSAEFVDVGDCIFANGVCQADGTTDPAASGAKIVSNCLTQSASLAACCNANPTAPACNTDS